MRFDGLGTFLSTLVKANTYILEVVPCLDLHEDRIRSLDSLGLLSQRRGLADCLVVAGEAGVSITVQRQGDGRLKKLDEPALEVRGGPIKLRKGRYLW